MQKNGKLNPAAEDIFQVVTRVHERCKGAYGVVAMITGHGLVGFRDPNGIRPLIYGSRETEQGMEYIIASESVAITALGFKVELISTGNFHYLEGEFTNKIRICPCFLNILRPDAIIDGISVYKARLKMG